MAGSIIKITFPNFPQMFQTKQILLEFTKSLFHHTVYLWKLFYGKFLKWKERINKQ